MMVPHYLEPYVKASRRHGGGFKSLLWSSPRTQRARFGALARAVKFDGSHLIDAGCGRADFLEYLLENGVRPGSYVGLEAVEALADAAEARGRPLARIVRGDFIRQPSLLQGPADFILFSGSLNTLSDDEFEATLSAAWAAAGTAIVFNFLSSPLLAGNRHLNWHAPADVARLAVQFSRNWQMFEDYLEGDCTMRIRKGL